MLHLFNKTYLEFDSSIDINLDRVVISDRYGIPMLKSLEHVTNGDLISYGKTVESVLGEDSFVGFIEKMHQHGLRTNKKVIIFCDKENYNKFISLWFKLTAPNLDESTFTKLTDFVKFKERIVKNTQLATLGSLSAAYLSDVLTGVTNVWRELPSFSTDDITKFKSLSLNSSYEFLLASHLSGSEEYLPQLLKTVHLFLSRWFREALTDNRQMILMNITNHKMLSDLGIDYNQIDITKENPLDGIEPLKYYADDEIWETTTDYSSGTYGICNLKGLSSEKLQGLKNTLLSVYQNAEGMETNRTCFSAFNWIEIASKDSMTKEELDEILEFLVNEPFDTCLVPRFDFENVNFALFLHFLKLKKDGNTTELAKYKLL